MTPKLLIIAFFICTSTMLNAQKITLNNIKIFGYCSSPAAKEENGLGFGLDIFAVRADGSEYRTIVADSSLNLILDLNLESTKLLYISNRKGDCSLYRANTDGTQQEPIPNTILNGSKHTDGLGLAKYIKDNSIVFTYNSVIYIVDSNGNNSKEFWSKPNVSITGLAYSTKLNMVAVTFIEGKYQQILLLNADGSEYKVLQVFDRGILYPNCISFSEDGTKLYYSYDPSGNPFSKPSLESETRVYMVDIESKQSKRLTADNGKGIKELSPLECAGKVFFRMESHSGGNFSTSIAYTDDSNSPQSLFTDRNFFITKILAK